PAGGFSYLYGLAAYRPGATTPEWERALLGSLAPHPTDGRVLATVHLSTTGARNTQTFVLDTRSGTSQRLDGLGMVDALGWSPDGKYVVVVQTDYGTPVAAPDPSNPPPSPLRTYYLTEPGSDKAIV